MENRRPALYGAVLLSLFIIYGSLAPFNWEARPNARLVGDVLDILLARTVESSRVDFATNALLSAPTAFCLMVYLRWRTRVGSLWLALAVMMYSILLALAVETLQLHMPGRVSSKFDILAQTLGAAIAVTLWSWRGEQLWTFAFDWSPFNQRHTRWQKVSTLYLVSVYVYGLLPLDLTLGPGDLHDKWKLGKIFLIPFHGLSSFDSGMAYQYLSVLMIWGVAAWLIRMADTLPAIEAIGRTALAATVLEVLQLFVLSRTTDSTDVALATLGGICANLLGRRGSTSGLSPRQSFVSVHAGRLALLMIGWSLLSAALAWYPFAQRDLGVAWREGLASWWTTPLSGYLDSGLLTAATSALQKMLLFAPWGALAAWLLPHSRIAARGVLAYGLGLMLVIELGKLFVQGKVSNPSNLGIEALAIWVSYRWVKRLRIEQAESPNKPAAPKPARHAMPSHPPSIQWLWLVLPQVVLSATALSLMPSFEALPYSIRGLIDHSEAWQILVFAFSLFWCVLPWAWWNSLPPARRQLRQALTLVLLQPLLLYLLLRLSVPPKLVFDIVGSPWLDWPWESERALRFLALFLLPAWSIWSAHRCFDGRPSHRNLTHALNWLLGSIAVAALWHYVVVVHAATDNLVELMRDGGSMLSTAYLFLWCFLLYSSALQSAQILSGGRPASHWLTVLGAGLLAYALLDAALEPVLVKYGQAFSAWQFLLSQDRQHYAPEGSLPWRYAAAHITLVLGLMWVLLPLLLAQGPGRSPRIHRTRQMHP